MTKLTRWNGDSSCCCCKILNIWCEHRCLLVMLMRWSGPPGSGVMWSDDHSCITSGNGSLPWRLTGGWLHCTASWCGGKQPSQKPATGSPKPLPNATMVMPGSLARDMRQLAGFVAFSRAAVMTGFERRVWSPKSDWPRSIYGLPQQVQGVAAVGLLCSWGRPTGEGCGVYGLLEQVHAIACTTCLL